MTDKSFSVMGNAHRALLAFIVEYTAFTGRVEQARLTRRR